MITNEQREQFAVEFEEACRERKRRARQPTTTCAEPPAR
jgi:hypothetical protein